jgi:hypothetical protein
VRLTRHWLDIDGLDEIILSVLAYRSVRGSDTDSPLRGRDDYGIVQLSNVGANWTTPCRKAVTALNDLFRRNQINVTLTMSHSTGPTITVKVDPSIQGSAVHGRTTAESTDTAGCCGLSATAGQGDDQHAQRAEGRRPWHVSR